MAAKEKKYLRGSINRFIMAEDKKGLNIELTEEVLKVYIAI